nr:probable galacturonosyltransferase 6 isoform X2 [Ipomoea batatas]
MFYFSHPIDKYAKSLVRHTQSDFSSISERSGFWNRFDAVLRMPENLLSFKGLRKHWSEVQILRTIEEEKGEVFKETPPGLYKDEVNSSSDFEESNRSIESGNEDDASLGERNMHDDVEKEKQHGQLEALATESNKRKQSEPKNGQRNRSRFRPQRLIEEKVKEMKDQIIRARSYLNFVPPGSNSHFAKEMKLRIKELERTVDKVTKGSELSRRDVQRMKAMRSTLSTAHRRYPDCTAMVKKLRAMTYNAEEQLRSHKRQAAFLTQLTGRITPKGLHCLSMQLTAEYFALQREERELPNQHKLHNPDLYHFAVFSDNILACSVVVNSTISAAEDPERIVFHIVTDSLNLPAMSMWFLLNTPGKATIQIQSIDGFEWLSTKHNATLHKQGSLDPKYTSALNHLRFYLPDVFPLLDKILLLDHDVVVLRDLTALWGTNMNGKVNAAVETCEPGEPSFRPMNMLINFTDPVMAEKFDNGTCTWAFGMNLFNLQEWRRQNLTGVYHKYLDLGSKKSLFKGGSLAIGWITFYKNTVGVDRRWHVSGLGYEECDVRVEDIEEAAVIHYDGTMKPWLDSGVDKYKSYWKKYLNTDNPYLQHCNINS